MKFLNHLNPYIGGRWRQLEQIVNDWEEQSQDRITSIY